MKQKITFLLFVISIFSFYGNAQTQFWYDDFESATSPSSGLRNPENNGGSTTTYFKRAINGDLDLSTASDGDYSNFQGSYFWAGEDHDGAFGAGNEEQQIDFTGINISGKTNLSFKGLFAAASSNGQWENLAFGFTHSDYIIIEYSIDGSPYTTLIAFYADGVTTKQLREDTNGDLIGDGTLLSKAFGEFSKSIPGTGTTLNLRLRAYSNNTNNEEWAVDNLRLFEVTCIAPTVPTITATANPICSGNSTTLNISGTLNDATQWNVYTGSCGGTLIGTTATSSFVVSPSTTTTYYIRGEVGCVTPGTCGTITINVNPQANAGVDGMLMVCNDSSNIINLYSVITGEQPGGLWSRLSGTGGTFNAGAGTFTTLPSASYSTFAYTVSGTSPCPNDTSIVTIAVFPSINNTISENTTGVLTANESGADYYQWYACPNTLLSGENNQSFTPSATGDYKVEIIVTGCMRESSCYTVTTLDTKAFENEIKFVMYPNPTNGLITIKTDKTGDFKIFNQLGQTVKTFTIISNIENNINVENLTDGVYFIKSSTNSQIKTQKLIIKK